MENEKNQLKKTNKTKLSSKKSQPFYIFVDIGSSLWDEKFAKGLYGSPYYQYVQQPKLKDSSVEALNNLLFSLGKQYKTYLVVLSNASKNSKEFASYLKDNGLVYDSPIFLLNYNSVSPIAENLESFMNAHKPHDNSVAKLRSRTSSLLDNISTNLSDNFVLIDGNEKFAENELNPENTIKINPKKESLTQKQVNAFLKSKNIPISEIPKKSK